MIRPLEIVGGGLAGLSLGLALRRRGIPATLHEAGSYPRHRVCGEFIAGLSEETISRLELQEVLRSAVKHETVTWFRGEHAVKRQRLPGPAWGLSRHTLDARLAEAFVHAGGDLRTHSRVKDSSPCPGRILTVGRRRGRSAWIGLKTHIVPNAGHGEFAGEGLEVHLGRDAYVGLSAVEGGRWNLCGLFKVEAALLRQASAGRLSRRLDLGPEAAGHRFHVLLEYMSAAGLGALAERIAPHIDPPSFTAVAALQMDHSVRAEPGLALGDACAMIPPFTGNGMAMAFQCAELATDLLCTYAEGQCDWTQCLADIQAALRRQFSVRLASASLLHPFLLRPRRQRWIAAAARAGLLPLRPLYALLH